MNKDEKAKLMYISLVSYLISTILAIPTWMSISIIIVNMIYYIGNKSRKTFIIKTIPVMLISIIITVISGISVRMLIVSLLNIYMSFINYDIRVEYEVSRQRADFLYLPLLTLAVIEFMQGNIDFWVNKMFFVHNDMSALGNHIAMWASYILVILVEHAIYGIAGNRKVSSYIVNNILYVLGIINMIVLSITSAPLMPTDIYIFKTAMSVMNQQKIDSSLITSIIIYVVILVVINLNINKTYKYEHKASKVSRGTSVILSVVILMAVTNYIQTIDFLTFRSNILYGFPFHFLIECRNTLVEPEGYKVQNIDTSIYDVDNNKDRPNIIFIMSEAFSDLETVYNLKTSEEVMPYFNKLRENYPNGILYSSVIGNNTVSSEFESISGVSTAFTDKGSNIYQKYLNDNMYTVGDYYKELGYKTGILHGSLGSNYNRKNVYTELGYDRIVFENDFSTKKDYVRHFISDDSNFNEILKLLEDTEEPLFLMNITMQNHGDYLDEDVDTDNRIREKKLDNKELNNYLSLINQSDIYLEEFLQNIEEPTLIVIYGDHQPMIRDNFYEKLLDIDENNIDLEKQVANYEVPYLIWSNFDTSVNYKVPEKTSMNYLPLIINDYLGYERTEWYDLLSEVIEIYPVITGNFIIDENNNIHDITSVKARLNSGNKLTENEELLQKYQYACYELVTR